MENVCELVKTEEMKAKEARDRFFKAGEELDETIAVLQIARKITRALTRAFNPSINEGRSPHEEELMFMWPAEKIHVHHRDAIKAYMDRLNVTMSIDTLEDELEDAEAFFFKIAY